MSTPDLTPEQVRAAYDAYHKVMVEVAYDAGWPEDPREHLELIQKEVRIALSQQSPLFQEACAAGRIKEATGPRHPNLKPSPVPTDDLIELVDACDMALFRMTQDPGWSRDPMTHVRELQTAIRETRATYHALAYKLRKSREQAAA